MFDKNWNTIIVLLIIVLSIAYYCNNYEGFAGSLDAKNAEAIANVASLYNKDEVKVTNITATNNLNVDKGALYVGDGTAEWSNSIKVRGGVKEGGYIEFQDKDKNRQSFIMGSPGGAFASGNFAVNGNLSANGNHNVNGNLSVNGGVLETGNWDRFIIRPKTDDKDKGYWYFNIGGNHGYFNKDGIHKWQLINDGQLCLGGTCINETELANLKVAARSFGTWKNSQGKEYDVIKLQGMATYTGCGWDSGGSGYVYLHGGCNLRDAGRFDGGNAIPK